MGLDDSTGKIKSVAKRLEDNLVGLNFKPEGREFQAHITLARIKTEKNILALARSIEEFRLPEHFSLRLDQIILYKSTLTFSGPVYKELANLSLGVNKR